MSRPDDSLLTPEQLQIVQAHADRLLQDAGAIGSRPTALADILAAARVTVVDDEVIDQSLLRRFLAKARTGVGTLKTALSKVLGLFEPHERLVVIDKNLPEPRVPFIKLHETGHGMPHQAAMYGLMQDCDQLLDPDVTDLFEREANVFASEVLFQGEQFSIEAFDSETAIGVPMQLAKRFGASQYSTFRRYVRVSPHFCALLALDPVMSSEQREARLRRAIASRSFDTIIDLASQIPAIIAAPHPLAAAIPQGSRRMVKGRQWRCIDRNGGLRDLTIESFFTGHQILVLLIGRW